MYVLIRNQVVEKFPYSIGDLRKDNPQVSFPKNPSSSLLAEWGVYPVFSTSVNYDSDAQVAVQEGCVFKNDRWETNWVIRDMNADEVAQRNKAQEERRAEAYRAESDPLFFKFQRGEATKEKWLAKVSEIKARYQDI